MTPALLICLLILVSGTVAQNQAPLFTQDMNGFSFPENTPVGVLLYTLAGTDPDGSDAELTFGVESDTFVVADARSGEVRLSRNVDYETETALGLTVWISDGENKVRHNVTVTVLDENDNAPRFSQDGAYTTLVPETAGVGLVVLRDIAVTDADTTGNQLRVVCKEPSGTTQFSEVCSYFTLRVTNSSSRSWRGDLVLTRTLDFEAQSEWTLMAEASDGENVASRSIEVEVVDVQDTPPRFTGSVTKVVNEGIPPRSEVMLIQATDGDREVRREVRYALIQNPGSLFEIDPVSGMLRNKVALDREDPLLSQGVVTLTVQACELLNGGDVATSPDACTQQVVTVTVTDVNDNRPTFDPDYYTVNLTENAENGTVIPRLQVMVTDLDQGANSEFRVSLTSHTDLFAVAPAVGTHTLSCGVVVRLRGNSTLDYDLGQKVYELNLLVEETQTSPPLSHQAVVQLQLIDVNDNPPVFPQDSYGATVSETAGARTPVIRITASDLDSGLYGSAGVRYRLIGNGANMFRVDPRTGEVTVNGCFTPGTGNCLDYEKQPVYNLIFQAGDNLGEGFYTNVPLTITLRDENDNAPRFDAPRYVSFIREKTTNIDPPVQVKATDADSSYRDHNKITYSIVGGNTAGLWAIDPETGVVTATRPVPYPQPDDHYLLTVQAADPSQSVTTNVQIFVIDVNDNAPEFSAPSYETSLREDTPPGTQVLTVVARDNDPPNENSGKVQYRIATGGQDRFVINETTGLIRVAPGAGFDYDLVKQYNMTVLAVDQGQPQLSASVNVTVYITDANNKNPYFTPSTVRRTVREDAAVGTNVTRMSAMDPDSDAFLVYYLEDPRTAYDAQGNVVNLADFDYRNLFSIERTSGIVRVNRSLDRDMVAQLYTTVKVVDDAANKAGQSATATLIITILEVNTRPPEFGPPWTPQRPWVDVSVQEEQGAGSYVTTLVATHPAGVREYRLVDNPNDHFSIDNQTGVVTVARPLDYDSPCDPASCQLNCDLLACEQLQVIAVAIDNGEPQLTATATINVAIDNINDEHPTFSETLYEVSLPENSPGGTTVVTVTATDADKGDYGVVRYSLTDPDGRFTIDERTGVITVVEGAILDREAEITRSSSGPSRSARSAEAQGVIAVVPGAVLDRETEPVINLPVEVYDSPNNPDDRKRSSVQVYITLTDVNDHPPVLDKSDWPVTIYENLPPGSPVVTITVTDGDGPDHQGKDFFIVGDSSPGLFMLNTTTGQVTTNSSLVGREGVYNVTIGLRDPESRNVTGYAYVIVTVRKSNNGAPTWVTPADNNRTVYVLENQYVGMIVTTVVAVDDKDQVTYGFGEDGSEMTTETPEFTINPNTGVITARIVFDRELRDTYTVQLVARDSGQPPFDSRVYLTIRVNDTDDHDPEFPAFRNCCTIPYRLSISEDEPIGTYLGQVIAEDRDLGDNANVRYYITGGNEKGMFVLNETSGYLYLQQTLDKEDQAQYNITIVAQDREKGAGKGPECRCTYQDAVTIIISVRDKNTYPPTFPYNTYNACVPLDAQPGREVVTLAAIDPDTGLGQGFVYAITNLVNYPTRAGQTTLEAPLTTFVVGATNGSVATNRLMASYEYNYFILTITATDPDAKFSATQLRVWVTSPSQRITLTFNEPKDVIEADLDNILEMIKRQTNNGVVCVEDLRYHLTVSGGVDTGRTDLVIHVIDGRTLTVINGDDPAAAGIIRGLQPIYGAAALTENVFWTGFVTWPVLVAILVIAGLLLLLLLLLLLICCCCPYGLMAGADDEYYAVNELYAADTQQINPIWQLKLNEYEDQELKMAVKEDIGAVNAAFVADEKVTAANGYVSHTEIVETRVEDTIDSAIVDSDDVRIVAPLEKSAAVANGNATGGGSVSHAVIGSSSSTYETTWLSRQSHMVSEATMTDGTDRPVQLSRSTDYLASIPAASGPARIGATLTTRNRRQHVIGDNLSDLGGQHRAWSLSNLSGGGGGGTFSLPPGGGPYDDSSFPRGVSRQRTYSSGYEPADFSPAYDSVGGDFPVGGVYQGEITVGGGGGGGFSYRREEEWHEEGYIPPVDDYNVYSYAN